MNKVVFSLIFSIGFTIIGSAQAYEGTVEYNKKKQDAFMIDYSYSPQAVENALLQKMDKLGYKPKEEKGFLNKDKGFKVYKGAYVTEANDQRLDYILKVEPKSRKNQDESVLYMIIQKDGVNARAGFNADETSKIKLFLKNLKPDVEAADLELQIKNQQEVIAKAEKKLRDLKDDQQSLEKKLDENKVQQDNTQKDIESQKQSLGVLIGKRKTD
jgi:hypothetical protein